MDRKHNPELVTLAGNLRKNMTKEERWLWFGFLRTYDVRFLRQKILGKYIVDFYCPQAKLVVELDGSQHYEVSGFTKDSERTAYLQQYNITVVHIPNNEVSHNFSGVCEYIDLQVKQSLSQLR